MNAFEEGKGTEPAGKEDGVVVVTPEMATGGLVMSTASHTGVAMALESVLTDTATIRPTPAKRRAAEGLREFRSARKIFAFLQG